jgi:hypothetical protein
MRAPSVLCSCGNTVSLPVVKGLPMSYQCVCGKNYDAQGMEECDADDICLCGAPSRAGVCSDRVCVCSPKGSAFTPDTDAENAAKKKSGN